MIQLTWKEVMYLHDVFTDLTVIRLKVMRSLFCRFCQATSLFVVLTFKYEKHPICAKACVYLFTFPILCFLPCVKLVFNGSNWWLSRQS